MSRADLIALADRLDPIWDTDHKRLCQGREYTCSCGFDEMVWKEAQAVSLALREMARPIEVIEEDKNETDQV